jgi:riboflavin biosynthesis pyrimidine reductase/pyrimidine deaminase RibD-like protein
MRPYVVLSCATSADGYLDDASPERLILSGPEDLDRVDELRASCDAILVGANTIRKDKPRLLIRDPRRVALREARGLPPHPLRVTITTSGNLELPRPFVVYAGAGLSLGEILEDLISERGVVRLLVEGGASVLGQFIAQDLANELHHAVAPFFVADPRAPRLDIPAAPDWPGPSAAAPDWPGPSAAAPPSRMTIAGVRRVGDMTVSHYLLGPGGADERFLRWAIELSRQCPPSVTAFSVGAVVVSADGEVLSAGYSREQSELDHAEEVALRKLAPSHGRPDPRLRGATIYSSLVPCGARASRPVTCAQHIIGAGLSRVVYAWREPPIFAAGDGAEKLAAAGISVTEIPALARAAKSINSHLPVS